MLLVDPLIKLPIFLVTIDHDFFDDDWYDDMLNIRYSSSSWMSLTKKVWTPWSYKIIRVFFDVTTTANIVISLHFFELFITHAYLF